jgi:hypothetical protein
MSKIPHDFETLSTRRRFPASDGEEVNVIVAKYSDMFSNIKPAAQSNSTITLLACKEYEKHKHFAQNTLP